MSYYGGFVNLTNTFHYYVYLYPEDQHYPAILSRVSRNFMQNCPKHDLDLGHIVHLRFTNPLLATVYCSVCSSAFASSQLQLAAVQPRQVRLDSAQMLAPPSSAQLRRLLSSVAAARLSKLPPVAALSADITAPISFFEVASVSDSTFSMSEMSSSPSTCLGR